MKLLKKNNVFLGIVLASIAPFLAYGLLYLLNNALEIWLNAGNIVVKQDTLRMTSIFLNLFIFIPYLKHDRYERTGRGVLLVTFIGVVILFLTML
jgi:hypothetical protein